MLQKYNTSYVKLVLNIEAEIHFQNAVTFVQVKLAIQFKCSIPRNNDSY